jgi:hypothetical protein
MTLDKNARMTLCRSRDSQPVGCANEGTSASLAERKIAAARSIVDHSTLRSLLTTAKIF